MIPTYPTIAFDSTPVASYFYGSSNVLCIDGVRSVVGVRTNNPAHTLDVNGDLAFSGTFLSSGMPFIIDGVIQPAMVGGLSNAFYQSLNGAYASISNIAQAQSNTASNQNHQIVSFSNTFTASFATYSNDATTSFLTFSNASTTSFNSYSNAATTSFLTFSNASTTSFNSYSNAATTSFLTFSNASTTSFNSYSNLATASLSNLGHDTASNVATYSNNVADTYWRIASQVAFSSNAAFSNITATGTVRVANLVATNNIVASGTIVASGDITAFSDSNLKTDVLVIPDAMDKLGQISGYTFARSDLDDGKRYAGVLAQEVDAVLPEVVTVDPSTGLMSVAYGNITALLIQAVKELGDRVSVLESKN
jgi:hypothetical protein